MKSANRDDDGRIKVVLTLEWTILLKFKETASILFFFFLFLVLAKIRDD